jgi:4-carboxymuconolactone decarboxylase
MHSRRRRSMSALAAIVLIAAAFRAGAQDRMPPLAADLTAEQTQALAELAAERGPPAGPWISLLRSPQLMTRTRQLGDYLDFESVLPGYLRELVILLTAREWAQNYEWNVHYPLAIEQGFSPEMARAVAEGRRPEGMVAEEEILYDFCTELQRNHTVSDVTYDRALSRFGEQGIVEAVSVMGYYTMLAMISNTARTPLPAGVTPALAPFLH